MSPCVLTRPPSYPPWCLDARLLAASATVPVRVAGAAPRQHATRAVAYYRGVTYARDERLALCALLDKAGPDAPTLCEGWRTVELAAHLVLREHRPDAAMGILGGPLAIYTERVLRDMSRRIPYSQLVQTIRKGPPRLSIYAIPGADAKLNFTEYLVHHEDVRRGQPGWQPRDLHQRLSDQIWAALSRARLMLRRVPVGIEFARDDLTEPLRGPQTVRLTVRPRTPVVTVIGAPAELLMWTFGRTGAAQVKLEGAEADVAALQQASWGV
jgi:uncharacterized protein (TIGR03085 family)